jgi:hypothetical protein
MTEHELDLLTQLATDIKWIKQDAVENKVLRDKIDKHLDEVAEKVCDHEELLKGKDQGLIKRVLNLEKRTWLLVVAVSLLSGGSGAFASQWMEEVLRQSTSVNIFQAFARVIGG